NLLLKYGFKKSKDKYIYSKSIKDGNFELVITVCNSKITTQMIDKDTKEEYFLHLLPASQGEFIGKIKEEYENILRDIAEKCCSSSIFTSKNTIRIIDFSKRKYGSDLEFLWANSPDCAVLRRKDTKKWYAIIMCVSEQKLGLKSDNIVEVINFRVNPEKTAEIIDHRNYFPAYHMNKRSWITANLSADFDENELEARIETSYTLAVK
ncbi:MAG: MmcQ/YjbR family DNA-binding protein, partial [Candidatus Gastranaerophilales bacterium]|nr:MmcQ/YjbR family DNA-binding protein [Candidatus Gastranaerophilales bacterium]